MASKPYVHEVAQASEGKTQAQFRSVFRTPEGQEVLETLREIAYGEVKNVEQPWRIIGRQDVVRLIETLVEVKSSG